MNSIYRHFRSKFHVFICSVLITILLIQTINAQSTIIIESVRPTFPTEGESFTIKGHFEPAGILSQLFIDDPVSGLCATVALDDNGSFSYTTQPALKAGLYGMVLKAADTDALINPEIYVISIAPDFDKNKDQYFYFLDGIDISLGIQGSSLDEETNSILQRVDGGWLDRISWLDDAYVLKDALTATSQIGEKIIEKTRRSPTTLIALGITGAACVGTGGTACAIMIPITVGAMAKISISESVEAMVNNTPNLNSDTRQLILEATRLSLKATDIYSLLSGANSLGEFKTLEESVDFWNSVASLAEDEILKSTVEEIETNEEGFLSSMTLQIVLKSGDCYIQKLMLSDNTAFEDNTYLDTRIIFKDGHELLCTAVQGDFAGRQIGAIIQQPTSFLTVIDPEGKQLSIPKNMVFEVQDESIQILEIDPTLGLMVRINRGSRHQIKTGATYRVYRPTKNIILGNAEILWIGMITIMNVMENSSTAMITHVNRGAQFKRGDYCRQ